MYIVYFLSHDNRPLYLTDLVGNVSFDISDAFKFRDRIEAYTVGRDISDTFSMGGFDVLALAA